MAQEKTLQVTRFTFSSYTTLSQVQVGLLVDNVGIDITLPQGSPFQNALNKFITEHKDFLINQVGEALC